MSKKKNIPVSAASMDEPSTGARQIQCAHALKPGDKPDILVVAAASPAFDAGCMFLVPVAGRGAFTRAEELSLNGVSGFIGPAPNERLGVVDVLFTSDMRAKDPAYTGLHLFTDVLLDHELQVFCRSMEKTEHRAVTRLSKMQFGRMTVYDAAIDGELAALAAPALFPGARLRLNGGDAIIAGSGARSTARQPSLSVIADLFPMRPDLLLCDAANILDRHNLAFALPLAEVPDAAALLRRAAVLAVERGADAARLAAAEDDLAAALRSGDFHPAAPGPEPDPR